MKRIRRAFGTLILSVCALTVPTSASAGFIGFSVHGEYLFPDSTTVLVNLGTTVVGPGAEFTSFEQFAYDLSDTQILIDNLKTSDIFWRDASFNGVSFFDIFGQIDPIIGVTVNAATTVAGLDDSRLSWTEDKLFINMQGLIFLSTDVALFDVQFAPVPEPASLALLGLGFATLGGRAWRRRNQK